MADPIERLAMLFERFPGIGPRQAQRFVQFLLRSSSATRRELIESVKELSGSVHQCPSCMKFHADSKGECSICGDPARDPSLLALVASDADIGALERGGNYRGMYFVMGGTISLASEKKHGLRERELLESIAGRIKRGLREIILAFPANPEGDFTALHIRNECREIVTPDIRITTLGRGLSTGSELEYADPETIKNALEGRR